MRFLWDGVPVKGFDRCTATKHGKQCRLSVVSHRTDDANREIHKFWNPEETYEWVDALKPERLKFQEWAKISEHPLLRAWRWFRKHEWLPPVAVVALLIIALLAWPHVPAANPSNWNHSDQETGITCSVPMPTEQQEAREYASCVHAALSDIESWH